MFEPEKPQKPKSQTELLLDLMRDYCFQRASSAQIWACFSNCKDHGRWLWPVRSPHFRTWITAAFFRRHQFYPSPAALRHAIRIMETMGCDFEADPALRVAGDGRDHVLLDLATHFGAAVEINAIGWISKPSSDHYSFYRPESALKLREPAGPGDLNPLRDLIHPATRQDWLRLLA